MKGPVAWKAFALMYLSSALPCIAEKFPPTWDNITISRDPKGTHCMVRRDGRPIFSFSVEPERRLVNLLTISAESDHLVLDTREAFRQGARKITMNTPDVDIAGLAEKTCAIDLEAEGKGNVQIYFEGASASKAHYYVDAPSKFGTRRRTATIETDLPADIRRLHARIDFLSGGVFKIYCVKFHEALPAREIPVVRPRLIFHAPFDGSPDAVLSTGIGRPVKAENIDFGPGRHGQAVRLTREAKSVLQFKLEKDLDPVRGTVAFWYKPLWKSGQDKKEIWRTLLSMPRPSGADRIGSGMLNIWIWGDRFRFDRSDDLDTYKTVRRLYDDGDWRHYAVSWNEERSKVYIDGRPIENISDSGSPLKAALSGTVLEFSSRMDFESFFVGCQGGSEQADGFIDDLRIYSAPLDEREIADVAGAFEPFRFALERAYVLEGAPFQLIARVERRAKASPISWKVIGSDGAETSGSASNDNSETLSVDMPPLKAGAYTIRLFAADGFSAERRFHVMGRTNPELSSSGNLKLELLETLTLDRIPGDDRFSSAGTPVIGELNGVKYMETAMAKGSRFAVRFLLPDADPRYCFELDIPDDKPRTADIIAQSSSSKTAEYELQVGYCAGDEYANQNRIVTQRYLYHAPSRDVSLIFMTARPNAPAAVARIRLYKVMGGLPEAKAALPRPVDGWNREVALYFEDPAIAYDFAIANSPLPALDTLINRTAAYMKYSGQSLLAYPGIWYQGLIGERYNPRNHPEDFIDAWLTKFDTEGLGFMATINQNNMEVPDGMITRRRFSDGSLHGTCVSIWDTGKPNPGGWHNTPPNFNILHPDAQKATLDALDEILKTGARHRSFRGVTLHLTRHCMHWLGDIRAGYNDYMIDGFTRDTGIKVPVDRTDRLRGKRYAEWLLANAREQWIAWRCKEVTRWFKQLAARVAAARPDLRLCINSFVPASPTHPEFVSDPDYMDSRNREAGLDATQFSDASNIIICQAIVPADYRWRSEQLGEPAINARMRVIDSLPLYYNALNKADRPWLHMHDRYWESAIGEVSKGGHENQFAAAWIKENVWRVTTLNPISYHAMRHYVLPLRYNDLLGISKGGFLIGTYGMEEYLIPFSRAFRALPAKRFGDLAGSTKTVKARTLNHDGSLWFYVVNTADKPATFAVSADKTDVTDLLTGAKPEEFDGRTLTLQLQPYQFRSFSASEKTTIAVVTSGQ